ncbi:MAG: hypothetical protein M3R09_09120, partial [Actinomycetota bacterium]|nr:hypothetical protein [Actinomycetota bacterium]
HRADPPGPPRPARQRYGEAGTEGLAWGTKFAIASVRSPLANHRVILGITHFPANTPGGEGKVFTDLAVDLAARSSGIHAFTADGAWRGTHLNHVQTITGCGVITPGRRRTARHDGIVIDSHGYAAQPLPWSRRRTAVKHSAAGTNYGRPPAPCSSKPSPRRRQRLHRADPAPDQTRHYPPQERNRAAPVLRPLHPALPRSETHDWWGAVAGIGPVQASAPCRRWPMVFVRVRRDSPVVSGLFMELLRMACDGWRRPMPENP